jgi:hypothetical protein
MKIETGLTDNPVINLTERQHQRVIDKVGALLQPLIDDLREEERLRYNPQVGDQLRMVGVQMSIADRRRRMPMLLTQMENYLGLRPQKELLAYATAITGVFLDEKIELDAAEAYLSAIKDPNGVERLNLEADDAPL